MINITNTNDIVIAIAKALGIELTQTQFTSYAVTNNKFVIAQFHNHKLKQTLINKIRVKKSLMAEEVFGSNSNSQIYLNDHLTPYYNKLYLLARNAKRDGKLASASSYGGKIRVRVSIDDAPTVIVCESQLNILIGNGAFGNSSNSSAMFVGDTTNTSSSTTTKASSRQRYTRPKRNQQAHTSHKDNINKPRKPKTNKNTNANSQHTNTANSTDVNSVLPTTSSHGTGRGKRKIDNDGEAAVAKKQKEQPQHQQQHPVSIV